MVFLVVDSSTGDLACHLSPTRGHYNIPATQPLLKHALEGMIAELRQIGVPVSLAERIDAVHSLRHLPVTDRDTVKAALRAVLVKTHDHELAFDTVFDLSFAAPAAADPNAPHNAPPPSQSGAPLPD